MNGRKQKEAAHEESHTAIIPYRIVIGMLIIPLEIPIFLVAGTLRYEIQPVFEKIFGSAFQVVATTTAESFLGLFIESTAQFFIHILIYIFLRWRLKIKPYVDLLIVLFIVCAILSPDLSGPGPGPILSDLGFRIAVPYIFTTIQFAVFCAAAVLLDLLTARVRYLRACLKTLNPAENPSAGYQKMAV